MEQEEEEEEGEGEERGDVIAHVTAAAGVPNSLPTPFQSS
jgi:hypothetical protein